MSQELAVQKISRELEVQISGVMASAQATEIASQEQYESAAAWRGTVKELIGRIKAWFKPTKEQADALHKAIVAQEKEAIGQAEAAIDIVGDKMKAYYQEQERIRAQREAELQAKAKLLEEERRLAEAEKLEAQGKTGEAMARLEAPIVVPTVHLDAPEASGVTYADHWVARCTDLRATIEFIVGTGRYDLLNMLSYNTSAANAMAAACKAQSNIPGIEFVNEPVLRQSTRGR
jgi:hypothetical protein